MQQQNLSLSLESAFQPLMEAELRNLAPSIYTDHAASRTTDQYSYTSTSKILEDLNSLGWFPVRAQERRVKKDSNKGFQRHVVYLRNKNFYIPGAEEGTTEAFPEICIINSHDGFNAFKFSTGLYRVACSNGLVIQSEKFGDFRLVHKGYSFSELERMLDEAVSQIPLLVKRVKIMQDRMMTADEIADFTKKAVKIREKYSYGTKFDASVEDVNQALRDEDKGDNLWKVYNRVQEKMLNGGFINTENNRKAKKIVYLDKILWLNKDLFELTEGYIAGFDDEIQQQNFQQTAVDTIVGSQAELQTN